MFSHNGGNVIHCRSKPESGTPYNFCLREPYIFVDEPADKLKCVICLDVALGPMQHEQCKKLFCEQCKDRWCYIKGERMPCPYCKEEGAKFLPHEESNSLYRGMPIFSRVIEECRCCLLLFFAAALFRV